VIITQVLHTIQGEGKYLGYPSILIRVGNCNLSCPYCDTKWSSDINQINKINNHDDMKNFVSDIIDKYLNKLPYPNIMITGGEPLLYIEDLYSFAQLLNKYVSHPDQLFFDIETNGTLLSYENIQKLIDIRKYINLNLNISPKFDIDAHSSNVTSVNQIMERYGDIEKRLKKFNNKVIPYCYKFIHGAFDESYITRFVDNYHINKSKVYCMSFTPIHIEDDEEFYKQFWLNNLRTADFCRSFGFIYSFRQHIYLFGRGSAEFND